MKKVLWVWIEDPTSNNIFWGQSLVEIKALTLLVPMKAKRGEKAAEEKIEDSRGMVHEVYGKKPSS